MPCSRLARLGLVALGILAPRPGIAKEVKLAARVPSNVSISYAIDRLEGKVRHLQKTQDQIDAENARVVRHWENTKCAFDLQQVIYFIARSVFVIRGIMKSCPLAEAGETGFSTNTKTCVVSAGSLVTAMSQIAIGVSLAASQCQATTNIDALCAAPISALFTPLSQYIAASTVASAACAQESANLPKDIELDRRLQQDPEDPGDPSNEWNMKPDDRRWQLGECALDALSSVMAMGQLAIGFDAATRNCPFTRGVPIQEEVSKAQCTVDAGFTFFSFSRVALFVSLAVEHCAPGSQMDALCVAACSSLTASSFAVAVNGAAIYLNCQIGTEKNAIIAGTAEVTQRRLTKEEVLDDLYRSAGFSRRLSRAELIQELAAEAYKDFATPEELWASLGYNISDPDPEWAREVPAEAQAILDRGNKMIKELQTEREEPSEELLKYGPEELRPSEAPEVLLDPEDNAATLSCSQTGVTYHLELPRHSVSLEDGVAACQARCARTPGCAHYSYRPLEGHCRLHGILAELHPGEPSWVSGPPGCKDEEISKATLRTMKRKLQCYHPHATYEPRDTLAAPRPASSIDDCQRRCQMLNGCAYFIFSEQDGMCSFADKSAVKLQPAMYSVAGPRHCADAAYLAFSGLAGGVGADFEERESPLAAFGASSVGKLVAGMLCGAVGTTALMWVGVAASRRYYSRVARGEPSVAQGEPETE